MRKAGAMALCLTAATLLFGASSVATAEEDLQTQIQEIKKQVAGVDELKAKLADLEKRLADSEKAQQELKKNQDVNTPTVTTAFKGVKAKIDGRMFVGVFESGDQGAYPNASTDINDAKIRFTFNPSKNITIVNRLNATGAKTGDFDYFYLDYAGAPWPASIIRLGQRKIDVGQETWVDNPIENMLISNSVSHVSGYGTGLALSNAPMKILPSTLAFTSLNDVVTVGALAA